MAPEAGQIDLMSGLEAFAPGQSAKANYRQDSYSAAKQENEITEVISSILPYTTLSQFL